MKYSPSRTALGVVACSAILLAGVSATPAGATLQDHAQAAAKQNWTKVWTKKLQPKADQRYWTKTQADAKYASKTEADAKYATKSDSDTKYATKADYYNKTDADAKYATKQKMYRGVFMMSANAAGHLMSSDISFGVTLAVPPTAHYIPLGGAVPAGCSGSAGSPSADPGHLCVFEAAASSVQAGRRVTNLAYGIDTATPVGAYVWGYASGPTGYAGGSWAMQPGGPAVVTNAKDTSLGPVGKMTG